MTKDLKIWLSLVTLYIVWGSAFLGIHYLVASVPPFIAAGSRNFLAGIILFTWSVFQKDFKFPTANAWFWIGLAGFLMLGVGNGLLTIAIQWVPSGYASLFPAIIPIWLVLLQFIIDKKRPATSTILGCFLGLIGVGFLLNLKQFALQGYEQYFVLGVSFLLIATFGWSCGVMVATKKVFKYPIVQVASMQMLVGGAILLIFSILKGEWTTFSISQVTPQAYYSFTYLLLIASLIGFTVFNWVSQQAPPTLVATYNYVNPLVAITLGVFLANEPFNTQLFIAAIFIVAAVFLIIRKK